MALEVIRLVTMCTIEESLSLLSIPTALRIKSRKLYYNHSISKSSTTSSVRALEVIRRANICTGEESTCLNSIRPTQNQK